MSGKGKPQSVEDFTLAALWETYAEGAIPRDLDPENFVKARCREAFMGGALFIATIWHGLEKRGDISDETRVAASARFVSEGAQVLADIDLPEAMRTMRQ